MMTDIRASFGIILLKGLNLEVYQQLMNGENFKQLTGN